MAYFVPRLDIISLPEPSEIERMGIHEVSGLVLALGNPDSTISGEAALGVNQFLAHAAMRLARLAEGPGHNELKRN